MPLQTQQTRTKKTSTNQIGEVEMTYNSETDDQGKVVMITGNSSAASPYRVTAHYDFTGKGLHVSVQNVPADFDSAVIVALVDDINFLLNETPAAPPAE